MNLLLLLILFLIHISKSTGTDEDEIISVLTNRSSQQRQQIKHAYESMFGEVSQNNKYT